MGRVWAYVRVCLLTYRDVSVLEWVVCNIGVGCVSIGVRRCVSIGVGGMLVLEWAVCQYWSGRCVSIGWCVSIGVGGVLILE